MNMYAETAEISTAAECKAANGAVSAQARPFNFVYIKRTFS